MIRILHVVVTLDMGGTETFILNNIKYMDQNIYKNDILVISGIISPRESEVNGYGGRVIYKKIELAARSLLRSVYILKNTILNNGPYDVVHSHINLGNAGIMLAAKLAGVPIRVAHAHANSTILSSSLKKAYNLLLQKIILNTATHLCACSENAGEGIFGKKHTFTIINNGIEFSKYADVTKEEIVKKKKELGIPDGYKVYGNISRYDKGKNFSFIVDVFYEMLKIDSSSFLILGGQDGDQKQVIEDKINKHRISKNILLLDKRRDVNLLINCMDTYIFPSISEGLGIAIVETQAAGIMAVVSTEVPRFADIGLGLIRYVPLSESAAVWAEIVLKGYSKKEREYRYRKFLDAGYDITCSVQRLLYIYRSNIHNYVK